MRLSLEKISIANFKGIRDMTIDFAATETHIFGMNGTGKSSIPDAFCWVLYNKDSHGNAPGSDSFREKPLDNAGRELHNLETMVELICLLDGKAFNLKRVQRENWVKKRGSMNPVYQGNASTYWINDVETALKDFKARISEIAPEEVFRLIGTLAAFNAQEWKKRRVQLLALSGEDVDARLLATDEYRSLADECGQRNVGIDDLRKILADQRKRTNTELQMIPVRIDEARKALPVFKPREVEDAEYISRDYENDIEKINGMIADIKAGTTGASITQQIVTLEQEVSSITRQIASEWADGKRQLEKRRDEASDDLRRAMEQRTSAAVRRETTEKMLSKATEQRDQLRLDYQAIRTRQLECPELDELPHRCPMCGQEYPPEKIQEIHERVSKEFLEKKRADLKDVKARGTDKAKEVESLTDMLEKIDTEMTELEARVNDAQQRRDTVSSEIMAYPQNPNYGSNPRLDELRQQIADLQAKMSESPEEKISALMHRKTELQTKVDEKKAIIARRDAGLETEKRIAELERQQKDIGIALAELEQLIALAEKFVTDRCTALEESINACFPTIRWKLFEQQINGGITDVCNCMIPCESGLVAYESANTAAQVNADLEIINVLSAHYNVYIPLFVDGAESVNVLAHTDSQLITLSVSTDTELTVRKEIA